MSANKDEALRCLGISKSKHSDGNHSAALKFAKKSISLHETKDGQKWLDYLEQTATSTTTASESVGTKEKKGNTESFEPVYKTNTETHTTHVRSRKNGGNSNDGNIKTTIEESDTKSSRTYTKEQEEAVKKIIANKSDYYKVLNLNKDCSENDIKKAYRKLALKFHPDKCVAPRTDEAFKIIAQAFDKLSNSDTRAYYDRYGSDDTRGGRAAAGARGGGYANPFGNFGNGRQFEAEIDPEMIFNMFFNQMGMGGMGPNVHVHSFGARPGFQRGFGQGFGGRGDQRFRQYMRPGNNNNNNGAAAKIAQLFQLLPLLLLLIPLLTTVISGLFSDPPVPEVRFNKSASYSVPFKTPNKGVEYFVNKGTWNKWEAKKDAKKLSSYNRDIEIFYSNYLSQQCEIEKRQRDELINQATGFFSVNEKKLNEAKNLPLHNCRKYKEFWSK